MNFLNRPDLFSVTDEKFSSVFSTWGGEFLTVIV